MDAANMLKPAARPRRAALHRRHHARRVPQAHREGPRPRAPLPAGPGRPSPASRTPSPSCAASRNATRSTTACASRTPPSSPPPPSPPLHRRPLPARQGHRPGRRGRQPPAHGDRLHAGRDRRAGAPIMQLEIETEALLKEKDDRLQGAPRQARKGTRRAQGAELQRLRPVADEEGRPGRVKRCATAKSTRKQVELEKAQRSGELEPASEIQYGQHPRTGSARRRRESPGRPARRQPPAQEEVDAEEIAEVVAKWTGIPVTKHARGRTAKARAHGGRLPKRVIGQAEAVRPSPTPCAAPAPAGRTPTAPSARSSSSAPPASARPSSARPGRVPLRRRAGHGPHRHVRVHGEALGQPPHRRAPRLRRLRGGRAAHRGRPPPALRVVLFDEIEKAHPTSSTCCSRCSTTAASPTARAARWTSRTPSS
jgi:hypothetical protein